MTAEARRSQILDVTHAIVDTEGFHAATPNRIAREAGINRSLLYQQFGDPAGLFVALIDREAARAGDQFAEVIAETAEPGGEGDLVSRFDSVVKAADAHPATWRLFLFPPQGAPPELHERLAQAQEVVRAYLAGELLRSYPDLPDPDYTARVLHAVARELLQLRLSDPDAATHERLHALVRSLALRAAAPAR
ncbi:TetR family transcriptional regulator [Mycolicibacter heraklionensis]|uniref:TetR family transcriptional regulator n=1 Tax=Mycolicibacter heraklionensis TaxID=512402 RepID=A0AA91IWI1_9MYCO|nr:TetR/AcrR family transcriptional regulator [Mycolicibacter heraklionensis]OBK82332.1 TetR family transcriptional regulator [Mycolicibacter heraklionensis]